MNELKVALKYSEKIKPEELAKKGVKKVKNALQKLKVAKLFKMNQNNNFAPASQEVIRDNQRTKRFLEETDILESDNLPEERNLGLPCIKR